MNTLGEPIKVLYVDSDPDRKARVAATLEQEDGRVRVHPTTTAEEGGKLLDERETHCVVSRYELSGFDGVQFLKRVRKSHPNLPFILFTGAGTEQVASEAISAGATDYLRADAEGEQHAVLSERVTDAAESSQRESRSPDRMGALRKYKRLVNSMQEAAWIYDRDGRFVVVNESMARWYNTTRDELAGTRGNLVSHARDEADTGNPLQELLDGERDQFQAEAELDFPGHGHAVLEYRLTPLAMGGVVEGIVGVARDITESKRRETRLRRYKTILETIDDGAFVVGQDRTVTYANTASLEKLGASVSDICGEPITELVEQYVAAEEEADAFARALDAAFADPDPAEPERVELTLSVDGDQSVYDYQLSPIVEAGTVTDVAVISRDVTVQNNREKRLEQQNERLDRFASVVGHDLRNPLHLAASRLELAREDADSAHLADALDAIERSQTLVEELLTLAREGEDSTTAEPVDIRQFARRCWETVETNNATLTAESTTQVCADASRLKQLFENLYRNAVEHGGSTVTVTVGELAEGFYVEDDGSGIPEETSEQVFVDGYSTDADGTGLGLVIVRNVVKAHDWEIDVAEGSDGGARFEITDVSRPDS